MTSNALKRPTTNSQESPPKRQKALESSSDDSGMGYVLPEFIPAPQKPLEPLPLPILLLVAAQDSQSKLRSLQGKLTVLGTKATGEKIAGHAEAYIDSMRLTASTIVSLRTVINSSQNAAGTSIGVGGGRLELRARCQLAEILIRYMGNTKSGVGSTPQRAGMAEVEDVIAKGLIAAYKVSQPSFASELKSQFLIFDFDSMNRSPITNIDSSPSPPNIPFSPPIPNSQNQLSNDSSPKSFPFQLSIIPRGSTNSISRSLRWLRMRTIIPVPFRR